MIRRPPRSTHCISSAASDVYKRQGINAEYMGTKNINFAAWQNDFYTLFQYYLHFNSFRAVNIKNYQKVMTITKNLNVPQLTMIMEIIIARNNFLISQQMSMREPIKQKKSIIIMHIVILNKMTILQPVIILSNLLKKFPNSKFAEECAYMSAYCQYMDSPKYNLDQTNTTESIKEFQLFINAYPQSERIPKCNELMDKLRGKLELKSFETAKLYFKMEDYKAAITTFNNVLSDFPDTPHKEEIMFDIIKANYKYAIKSIESKKKERYQAAIEAFDSFISAYPESSYLNQANICLLYTSPSPRDQA
eukprot:TRINITY_DN19372_c0_g1_i1.p1 TRINITY_DN19372_c0_g1~~TRINITY_DN19372_c0_g1_i1.p1  ORF type:complete len:306 (-),score=36.95 TRINITY_DN19372_c0_g1_i1:101-1018(-)